MTMIREKRRSVGEKRRRRDGDRIQGLSRREKQAPSLY